jgi:hypothetical protein
MLLESDTGPYGETRRYDSSQLTPSYGPSFNGILVRLEESSSQRTFSGLSVLRHCISLTRGNDPVRHTVSKSTSRRA